MILVSGFAQTQGFFIEKKNCKNSQHKGKNISPVERTTQNYGYDFVFF
jgi:hypothetical protein